ncbi:MAG: desulfoferrodoxin [Clostridia bacterium]|nr:desulfoferrodoxin [Clostridia bacterium]
MQQRFFKCKHCGQIIAKVYDTNVPVICCGDVMEELVAGVVEASKEKHIPTYKLDGNKVIVNVGSVEHPMTKEHYIEWISLQTKEGNQRKVLSPEAKPEVVFYIAKGDTIEAVYAYCNLHGLWRG